MKKNLLFSSMAKPCPKIIPRSSGGSGGEVSLFLTLLLLSSTIALAQIPLSIGDKLPEVTVRNVLHHPKEELNLSLFKGKLLILDFWATWCSPCIAQLPQSDSLQKVFQKEVQFLALSYEPREKVEKLLSKSKKLSNINLPIAVNEEELHKLFPHKVLPHHVWISPEGVVVAITDSRDVTATNIRAMLSKEKPKLLEKKDLLTPFDRNQPLLLGSLGITKDHVRFESVLSSHIEGMGGRYDLVNDTISGTYRITAINLFLEDLYRLAWSNGTQFLGSNRVVYEVKDASPIVTKERDKEKINTWMRQYSRCYELIMPYQLESKAFVKMQQDLSEYFPQYKASLQKRPHPCLALVHTSTEDKIKTGGQPDSFSFSPFEARMTNCSLNLLVAQLNAIYLQGLPTPVVNATNYTGKVDLILDTNLTRVESLRKALQPYGLDLINKDIEIDVLVIRDSKTN
jgi:thiol-disulfide isomerase/thioredoxin